MPPLYPLPSPASTAVSHSGAAALWNGTVPPVTNFLIHRPYGILYQVTAQVIPATVEGPPVPIALDGGNDNAGAHSTTVNNSRYTCQLAGLYHIIGQLGLQSPAIAGTDIRLSQLSIAVNGNSSPVAQTPIRFDTGPANAGGTVQVSCQVKLKVGDYVQLMGGTYFNPITTFTDYRRAQMFVHWASTT